MDYVVGFQPMLGALHCVINRDVFDSSVDVDWKPNQGEQCCLLVQERRMKENMCNAPLSAALVLISDHEEFKEVKLHLIMSTTGTRTTSCQVRSRLRIA